MDDLSSIKFVNGCEGIGIKEMKKYDILRDGEVLL